MKLCKDCRWVRPPVGDDARCGHPRARQREQNPVTGHTREYQEQCWMFRTIRAPGYTCGPNGDFFEPKDDKPAGFI